ncbi:hypothetical protein DL769_002477 [Monosporascus sp. CRB-8-3]|nr:hypothetical protein DL769_002477 [Monosporascus sp. CRB-8-3]
MSFYTMANQKRLSQYCAIPSIDVIILSFVHLLPQQENGYPGIDFGNQCWAEKYAGPGYGGQNKPTNNRLLKCAWFELTVRQAANPANAYYCRSTFGDVAIRKATYASENVASGKNFYQNLKAALNTASTNKRLSCVPR